MNKKHQQQSDGLIEYTSIIFVIRIHGSKAIKFFTAINTVSVHFTVSYLETTNRK